MTIQTIALHPLLRRDTLTRKWENWPKRSQRYGSSLICEPQSRTSTSARWNGKICQRLRQRRNFAGHHFCPVSRVFSIVNTSRYAIFPRVLAKFRWVALRRASPGSLDKSRGSRNCEITSARAPVLIKLGADLWRNVKNETQCPRGETFGIFDSIIILIFSLRLRTFDIDIFYHRRRLDHRLNWI